jgi:hypothetical protein
MNLFRNSASIQKLIREFIFQSSCNMVSKPSSAQDQDLMQNLPPVHIIQLFDTLPLNSSMRLEMINLSMRFSSNILNTLCIKRTLLKRKCNESHKVDLRPWNIVFMSMKQGFKKFLLQHNPTHH